jgi:lipoprotein-releasing system permease protein
MPFELFIGRRYLKAKKKQAFISFITLLSIAGVTVGVMALIAVIAVMTGAEHYMKTRLLAVQPHILLMRHGGPFSEYQPVIETLERMEGVESASPYIYTQVMLRSATGVTGAVLKGISPEPALPIIQTEKDPIFNPATLLRQNQQERSVPGILMGKALADILGVKKGDMLVYMIFSQGTTASFGSLPAMRRFEVADIFDSGLDEYDKAFAYIHIDDARQILSMDDSVTGIEIRLNDIFNAREIAEKIGADLGFPFWARDWTRMNQNLFSSLKLQKTVMFIILILIILVAGFCITSTLIMMVMEKTKDIAILKAMGASNQSIKKIFVFKGMFIGVSGTLLGVALGCILCQLLQNYQFIELPKGVYYFATLPVKLELLDVFSISSAALLICWLSTIYPARLASRLNPVEGIRAT